MEKRTEITPAHVLGEIERVVSESGFGYVFVLITDGRVERVDRCVQKKASHPANKPAVDDPTRQCDQISGLKRNVRGAM